MGTYTTVNVFYGAEIIDPPDNIYDLMEKLGTPIENEFGIEILEGDCNTVTWFMYMCLDQPIRSDFVGQRVGLWRTIGVAEHDPSSWWYEQAEKMEDWAEGHGIVLGEFDHYVTVVQR